MNNEMAMFMIQSVLADPGGRAGVIETAVGFLESLGVDYLELHSGQEVEGGTPREILTLLVDSIAQRIGADTVANDEPDHISYPSVVDAALDSFNAGAGS